MSRLGISAKRNFIRFCASAVFCGAALLTARLSVAQNVLGAGGFPSNWAVFVNAVPATGTGVQANTFYTSGGNSSEVDAQVNGTANQDGVAPNDTFGPGILARQTFTLNEQAMVVLPAFLSGTFTFAGGGANNFAVGQVSGSVQVIDTGTANQVMNMAIGPTNAAAPNNSAINDQFQITSALLPAGNYRVDLRLNVTGNASTDGANVSANGSTVTADFNSIGRNGLASSLGTFPTGLGSSRDAVNAPAARTTYGVDGTGIAVGVVEPDNPYTNHTSLNGAGKITVVNGPIAGDYRDEHTLAVSGIIASVSANNANAGIAPGATIVSAASDSYNGNSSASWQAAVNALLANTPGMRVMNMSATTGGGNGDVTFINNTVNANPNLTFVKSAGNSSNAGTITVPGLAANIITVGAVNRTFTQRASFSSFGAAGATPEKPDLVAPGEYINAPQSRDVNNNGQIDDFGRVFLGDDFSHSGGATTGRIAGTSFSAPHVAGAAALLNQYQTLHAAHHVADHRVMKAILLNSASTAVQHNGGGAWAQQTAGSLANGTFVVQTSLDQELGAGMLDVNEALKTYAPDEIDDSHNNNAQHDVIDTTSSPNRYRFWDFENVDPNNGTDDGTVDYLLGEVGGHLRATLTWDQVGATLPSLELKLFHEGAQDGNTPGGTPSAADMLIAQTQNVGENVKIFDFIIPQIDDSANFQHGFYLEVDDTSNSAAQYGLAVLAPEPGCVCFCATLVLLAGAQGRRRHRQ